MTEIERGSDPVNHRGPWFLPDARRFLYTVATADRGKSRVYVADLESKIQHEVLGLNSNAVYAPPGYILFLRDRTLMAQPFEVGAAKETGNALLVSEHVDRLRMGTRGMFSASENGVVVYTAGAEAGLETQLTWFNRSGNITGTVGPPGRLLNGPAISPDGATVTVNRLDPQTGFSDIWLHQLAGDTSSRFT